MVKVKSLSEFEPTLFVLGDLTLPSSCYRSRVKLRPRGVDLIGLCALLLAVTNRTLFNPSEAQRGSRLRDYSCLFT